MLHNETIRKLADLKLFGMASGFEYQLTNSSTQDLAFEDRFGLLVDQESTYRDNKRLQRLLKTAKLKENACLEDVNYRQDRGLDKSLIASLRLCTWVNKGVNLVITGPTGTGKTWLACAFGNQACRLGMSTIYHRVPLLLEDLGISHSDGSFRRRLTALGKADLLILDDLGIGTMTPSARNDLLEVIDQRTGGRATLVTSQFPADRWHETLSGGNPTVADAILDRLLSCCHRIDVKGKESMRKSREK